MKILQCACILGAIAALHPWAPRAPAREGEPMRASGEALARAALKDAHANLERDFAAFALATADPMPVASLRTTAVASADPMPVASLRPTVVASADESAVI